MIFFADVVLRSTLQPYMVTKPKVTKPKLWSNHEAEAEALTFWKYGAEAEAKAKAWPFSKHEAKAETKRKILDLWGYEAEAEVEAALEFWNHEAKAEAEAFASNEAEAEAEAAPYPCLIATCNTMLVVLDVISVLMHCPLQAESRHLWCAI